jgi:hypothetical protein
MHGSLPNSARLTSLVTEANALHAQLEHGWRRQLEDARRLGKVLLDLKDLKQIPVKVVHNLHAESTPHIGLLGGS